MAELSTDLEVKASMNDIAGFENYPRIEIMPKTFIIKVSNELKLEFIESDHQKVDCDILIIASSFNKINIDDPNIQLEFDKVLKSSEQKFFQTSDVSLKYIKKIKYINKSII